MNQEQSTHHTYTESEEVRELKQKLHDSFKQVKIQHIRSSQVSHMERLMACELEESRHALEDREALLKAQEQQLRRLKTKNQQLESRVKVLEQGSKLGRNCINSRSNRSLARKESAEQMASGVLFVDALLDEELQNMRIETVDKDTWGEPSFDTLGLVFSANDQKLASKQLEHINILSNKLLEEFPQPSESLNNILSLARRSIVDYARVVQELVNANENIDSLNKRIHNLTEALSKAREKQDDLIKQNNTLHNLIRFLKTDIKQSAADQLKANQEGSYQKSADNHQKIKTDRPAAKGYPVDISNRVVPSTSPTAPNNSNHQKLAKQREQHSRNANHRTTISMASNISPQSATRNPHRISTVHQSSSTHNKYPVVQNILGFQDLKTVGSPSAATGRTSGRANISLISKQSLTPRPTSGFGLGHPQLSSRAHNDNSTAPLNVADQKINSSTPAARSGASSITSATAPTNTSNFSLQRPNLLKFKHKKFDL